MKTVKTMEMKKKISLTLLFLLVNVFTLLADPGQGPCGGADIDTSDCPLDSGVIFLVALALAFAAIHLYRKQKIVKLVGGNKFFNIRNKFPF